MGQRPARLRFTEDDLANGKVKKAADKAAQATDKAEKAVEKLISKKKKSKIREETTASEGRKSKLRFGKAKNSAEIEKPSRTRHIISHASVSLVTGRAHRSVSEYEDDNVGAQAVHQSERAVGSAAYAIDHAIYSHKLKLHDKAEKLVVKSDKANVNALYEKFKKANPDASSNPLSKWRQKQAIKKEYADARNGKNIGQAISRTTKNASAFSGKDKETIEKFAEYCVAHSKIILLLLVFALLIMVIAGAVSSCSTMFQGGMNVVIGTSYTAEDEDIIGADDDYSALETALRNQIANIESTHSGYDEYRYDLDEINHNPYELTSYLTVLFGDYTRSEVQSALQSIFNQQYTLTLTEEIEVRTRTETRTGTTTHANPETGEGHTETYEYDVDVEYDYYILNVKLVNNGLAMVIGNSGLTDDEMERYAILLQTQGNRPYLFEGDIYVTSSGGYTDYDIPGDALTDTRFANMMREAEKYLGYPYVWGGSSPSTSFDCSGFVSWVINNCGNGWSVGRLTANGLMGVCDIIPQESASPGDLIFFQGTYNTSGASHVGIYVGDGMMIHCGNPISYASINSSYWQQHFYCFGRIRN